MASFTGTEANDTIIGGSGNDRINGKGGRDLLFGGDGDDEFRSTVFAGADTIDGGNGFDTASFDNTGWPTYSPTFSVRHATLDLIEGTVELGDDIHVLTNVENVLGTGNPDLTSTVDASKATTAITVNLGTGEVIALGSSIVKVSRFEDVIGGRVGDTLSGDAKPNTLDGRAGADTLAGGGDGDAYFIDNTGDRVVELLTDTGNDLVMSSINMTLAENVERGVLIGTSASILAGNTGDDWLIGNARASTVNGAAGNDILWGRGNNDILNGGLGNDFIAGGDGADRYTYASGDGLDIISDASGPDTLTLTGIIAADTTYYSVDTARDTDSRADALFITGAWGSIMVLDYFDNKSGAASLCGAGTGALEAVLVGADRMGFAAIKALTLSPTTTVRQAVAKMALPFDISEGVTKWTPTVTTTTAGDDYVVGLATGDVIDGGTGNDKLRSQVGNDTLLGGVGNDTLHGGNGHDILVGGVGDDFLVGGYGADILSGGVGNDIYNVADNYDTLIERVGGGRDLVYVYDTFTLADNFEDLAIVSTTAANGVGNSAANALSGNDAANVLSGLAGDDTLRGRGGNDTLAGGLGADNMAGGDGSDVFTFAAAAELAGDVIIGFDVSYDHLAVNNLGGPVLVYANGDDTIVSVNGNALTLVGVQLTHGDWIV